MKYKYAARTKQGELQTGFVESVSRESAYNTLTGHDLFILSLEETEARVFYQQIIDFFNRVKSNDVMIFTRQFATLLDAEISLGDSLKNLFQQTRNVVLKEAISEISSDIDSGLALSQAMEKHSNIFSSFYVSMIRSAEVTGRLEEVMGFLADYLEKEGSLLSRVRNALIYPAVVIVLFFVVVGIMLVFVFPQLAPIFAESNVPLPLVTRILLGTANFLAKWWIAVLAGIGIIFFLITDYFRSAEGKIVLDEIQIRLPVIGNLYKKMYVARFAESTGVLIKGGIPVAQALEISGYAIGSIIYQDILREVAGSVRGGQLLSQALAERENYFPPLVHQMVAVGEATGKLESLFTRISDFYTREIDDIVSNLVELIQPALMVVIGVMVAALFAAVLLPIFNLTKAF
ncbi:MAG: type II secretion system F family protein [Candidatus Harrisonbacteria bacterium]|nr:type II secretion system F family protein [Candidatus Harrisonbacteria bacterium]